MNYLILIIPLLAIFQLAADASAWDVLVVQKYRAKPYVDVVRGFESTDPGRTSVLVLEELPDEDPLREIRRRNPDLILALGADALAKVRKISSIPIIYCMVLNPAPLVGNEDNITGISMSVTPDKQLSSLRRNLPGLKKIGTVYNPARMSSFLENARVAGQKIGIQLVSAKANRPQDVPRALDTLPRDLDAYWMLPDSTVTSPEAVEATILYSIRTKIPVFTFSDKYLRIGAYLSLELNTHELGKQAGEMAKKIRAGTSIKNIPWTFAEQATLTVNQGVAAKFGIPLNGTALITAP